MKSAAQFRVVFVTAPDLKIARKLARGALIERLAACANLIPRIESHYWWQEKLEKSAEALIIFKTPARKLEKLEQFVLENHPYDTPEIVSISMSSSTRRYLEWLVSETIR